MDFGWLLFVLLAALLALFWKNGGGRPLDELFERDVALHHRVHRVLEKHPAGGTWQEYQAWMREEA
jgi:hypothetical protein